MEIVKQSIDELLVYFPTEKCLVRWRYVRGFGTEFSEFSYQGNKSEDPKGYLGTIADSLESLDESVRDIWVERVVELRQQQHLEDEKKAVQATGKMELEKRIREVFPEVKEIVVNFDATSGEMDFGYNINNNLITVNLAGVHHSISSNDDHEYIFYTFGDFYPNPVVFSNVGKKLMNIVQEFCSLWPNVKQELNSNVGVFELPETPERAMDIILEKTRERLRQLSNKELLRELFGVYLPNIDPSPVVYMVGDANGH